MSNDELKRNIGNWLSTIQILDSQIERINNDIERTTDGEEFIFEQLSQSMDDLWGAKSALEKLKSKL